jgi:hypothetical protein
MAVSTLAKHLADNMFEFFWRNRAGSAFVSVFNAVGLWRYLRRLTSRRCMTAKRLL